LRQTELAEGIPTGPGQFFGPSPGYRRIWNREWYPIDYNGAERIPLDINAFPERLIAKKDSVSALAIHLEQLLRRSVPLTE